MSDILTATVHAADQYRKMAASIDHPLLKGRGIIPQGLKAHIPQPPSRPAVLRLRQAAATIPAREKIDLLPAQGAQLGGSQSMSEGQEDHGRIPMAMPVVAGRFYQPLNFSRAGLFVVSQKVGRIECSRLQ